jgi:sugar phosphate permease
MVTSGFALGTIGLLLLAQIPVDGDYWTDLFPAFVVFGLGMSFAFVGQQIGAQMRVAPADAGIASGLINTSQQVGGAIAVAVGTTIAASAADGFAADHGTGALGTAALTHGYQAAFYVFAAVTALAAIVAALVLESKPAETELGTATAEPAAAVLYEA